MTESTNDPIATQQASREERLKQVRGDRPNASYFPLAYKDAAYQWVRIYAIRRYLESPANQLSAVDKRHSRSR